MKKEKMTTEVNGKNKQKSEYKSRSVVRKGKKSADKR